MFCIRVDPELSELLRVSMFRRLVLICSEDTSQTAFLLPMFRSIPLAPGLDTIPAPFAVHPSVQKFGGSNRMACVGNSRATIALSALAQLVDAILKEVIRPSWSLKVHVHRDLLCPCAFRQIQPPRHHYRTISWAGTLTFWNPQRAPKTVVGNASECAPWASTHVNIGNILGVVLVGAQGRSAMGFAHFLAVRQDGVLLRRDGRVGYGEDKVAVGRVLAHVNDSVAIGHCHGFALRPWHDLLARARRVWGAGTVELDLRSARGLVVYIVARCSCSY